MSREKLFHVRSFVLMIMMFSSGCTALVVGDVTQGGYSVSQNDTSLKNAIEKKFGADSSLRSLDLVAHSVNGNVSLHGTVSSRSIETRAIRIAQSISGVRKVVSKLTVLSR